jgi:hypothetical protein
MQTWYCALLSISRLTVYLHDCLMVDALGRLHLTYQWHPSTRSTRPMLQLSSLDMPSSKFCMQMSCVMCRLLHETGSRLSMHICSSNEACTLSSPLHRVRVWTLRTATTCDWMLILTYFCCLHPWLPVHQLCLSIKVRNPRLLDSCSLVME